MATPTRSHGVTTPRNPLTSTPNRPTASPRPSTGTLQNRPFSYKSPAVKTPVSVHSHSQRRSISSLPTSTPRPATAIHDELLNLNSPAAALIASIGSIGLTPLASGQDGLGITTGDATSNGVASQQVRNPDGDRAQRIQDVARILESRSLGRGITRDGIKRLVQKEQFDQQWDADTVNIAGVSVDLEIVFGSSRKDEIEDVTLNLVPDETGEPQLQDAASSMLKRQLTSTEGMENAAPWRDPTDFAHNLHYLSHHDQVRSVNCFQLVGDLFQTFRKIWREEKSRMRDRHEALHVCQGNVGSPAMDVGERLGLTTAYWIRRHRLMAATQTSTKPDGVPRQDWKACFRVEPGEPSVGSKRRWLADEALVSTGTTEDLFQEGQVEKPNWQDDVQNDTDIKTKGEPEDDMNVDEIANNPTGSLGVLFVCDFTPVVLIPNSVIVQLNSQGVLLQFDQNGMTTYQQAVLRKRDSLSTSGQAGAESSRLSRSVRVVDKNGTSSVRDHTYLFIPNNASSCSPITQVKFHHPRQFAEVIPIFRQYALLWSILESTTMSAEQGKSKQDAASPATAVFSAQQPKTQAGGIVKRSNKKAAQLRLDELLREGSSTPKVCNIDVSLDVESDPTKAKMEVFAPSPRRNYIKISIEILRNGILDVVAIDGLDSSASERMKQQASQVLALSEDIGVLVQWLLGQSRENHDSANDAEMG